ncbi:MAG: Unknown protein [uncultured Thiotrichaceae bacterium]|uniref:Uncharacterized protein n=1 Tax=uncultured Thiotrichaceae bacterium TaxID=298394 RepID=A0A6S6U2P8_9GAMM|nr:MAG: Unknown protein [uncultured Thiotrichaceae bacterium]
MVAIVKQRMTADMDEEFVVFLIGMRINKWWKVHKWLPVSMAMPKMIKELYENPDMGLISQESWVGRTTIMVQYWKSFEHLEAYAKNREAEHLPAWADFNKKVSNNGDVGIWHETYLVKKGCHESIYNNMPRFGLAKVGKHLLVSDKLGTAKERLGGSTD